MVHMLIIALGRRSLESRLRKNSAFYTGYFENDEKFKKPMQVVSITVLMC